MHRKLAGTRKAKKKKKSVEKARSSMTHKKSEQAAYTEPWGHEIPPVGVTIHHIASEECARGPS